MSAKRVSDERLAAIVANDEARGHNPPTAVYVCGKCRREVERYRGQGDMQCSCGTLYNAFGQEVLWSLDGDLPPAGFDPAYAGERWDDDY